MIYTLRVSCAFGTSTILHREIKRLGLPVVRVDHYAVTCEGDVQAMLRLFLRSRVATRIAVVVDTIIAQTFDHLFDGLQRTDRSRWLAPETFPDIIVHTKNCQLTSVPGIQSVAQKSLLTKLYGERRIEREHTTSIVLRGEENRRTVMIDVFGSVIQRGFRIVQGEAPLRENLAAAAVLMSGRRFREALIDPFAGSGTIAIEAYLRAANLPPKIAVPCPTPKFPWRDLASQKKHRDQLINDAKKQAYPGPFQITVSDRDPAMVEILCTILDHPILHNQITITHADAFAYAYPSQSRCITNPPYGKRIERPFSFDDIREQIFEKNELRGAIVYGGEDDDYEKKPHGRKSNYVYNGADQCRIWTTV